MSTQLATYLANGPGLGIDHELHRTDWHKLAEFVVRLERHTPFYFADLTYIAREFYGWDYEAIREKFNDLGRDFEFQTLRNYHYVASRFPLNSRAYGTLKFGHYDAVASLVPPPANGGKAIALPTPVHHLLLEAAREQWPVSELRRRAKLLLNAPPAPEKETIYWTIHPHRVREILVPHADFTDVRWSVLQAFVTDDQWQALQDGTVQFAIKVFAVTPLEGGAE